MWLSAFAFLATVALVFGTIIAAAIAAMLGRTILARVAAIIAATGTATYLLALAATGIASPHRELSFGQEKHICEIDCHLAYSVLRSERNGDSYVVTMRMRFDAETISSRRDNSPLTPGSRHVALIDADGLEYRPASSSGLERALRPGESTDLRLEFQLPQNVKPAYLRFEDADPLKRLLIGSETAPLHKAARFRLS